MLGRLFCKSGAGEDRYPRFLMIFLITVLYTAVSFSMLQKSTDGKVMIYYKSPTASLEINENGSVSANSFIGEGSNLIALNATNVASGTLATARLDSSVSLLGQEIGTSEIADGAITNIKITSVSANKLVGVISVDASAAANSLIITANGNVGIGTNNPAYKLTVNGEPAANGYTAFTNYSDRRLKRGIEPFESVLGKVMRLEPKTFYYNDLTGYDEETKNRKIYGFIAQELQTVFPEMVGTTNINSVEYLDTNLSSLEIYLVKALQELKQEKDREISSMTERYMQKISALEKRLEKLEE